MCRGGETGRRTGLKILGPQRTCGFDPRPRQNAALCTALSLTTVPSRSHDGHGHHDRYESVAGRSGSRFAVGDQSELPLASRYLRCAVEIRSHAPQDARGHHRSAFVDADFENCHAARVRLCHGGEVRLDALEQFRRGWRRVGETCVGRRAAWVIRLARLPPGLRPTGSRSLRSGRSRIIDRGPSVDRTWGVAAVPRQHHSAHQDHRTYATDGSDHAVPPRRVDARLALPDRPASAVLGLTSASFDTTLAGVRLTPR